MTKELWRDIKGYEGYYQVSSIGRVKRIEKIVMQFNYQLQKEIPITYPKRYLKFDNVKGYNRVTLSLGNKQERFVVHRLVAQHFIDNPDNKPCVNHINSIRIDNRVDNLEWCTHEENERHKRISMTNPIISISPTGDMKEWEILKDCARGVGIHRSNISRCLTGKQESSKGYKFRYKTPTE